MVDKKLRPSPSVSAQEHPNEIMLGNDGEDYVSKPDKNGVYHWKKLSWKKSAEEYYMQFPKFYLDKKFFKFNTETLLKKLKKVKDQLKKHNIHLLEIGWNKVYNFIDYAWEEARNKYKDTNNLQNLLFYTDNALFRAKNQGVLFFQWDLNKENLKIVNELMKKEFGKKYIEPPNVKKAIIVKL